MTLDRIEWRKRYCWSWLVCWWSIVDLKNFGLRHGCCYCRQVGDWLARSLVFGMYIVYLCWCLILMFFLSKLLVVAYLNLLWDMNVLVGYGIWVISLVLHLFSWLVCGPLECHWLVVCCIYEVALGNLPMVMRWLVYINCLWLLEANDGMLLVSCKLRLVSWVMDFSDYFRICNFFL